MESKGDEFRIEVRLGARVRAWGAARDRVALDGGDTRDVLHGHLRRRLCVRQAEKVLNKFTLFGSAASKNEAAAELFQKAGNAYKMAKKCKPAVHVHAAMAST